MEFLFAVLSFHRLGLFFFGLLDFLAHLLSVRAELALGAAQHRALLAMAPSYRGEITAWRPMALKTELQ